MKKAFFLLSTAVILFVAVFSCKKQTPTPPVFSPTTAATTVPAVINTATNTAVVIVSSTPTAIKRDTAVYSFEDGTDMGWTFSLGGTSVNTNSNDRAYRGTHSLKLTGTYAVGDNGAAVTPSTPINLVGKYIQLMIWVPADFPAANAQIYIQSGDWCWQNGAMTPLVAGAWTLVYFDTASPSYTSAGTPDLTNVLRLGVKFVPSTLYPGTGSVYFDSVDIKVYGTPTSTNSPSPTFTMTKTPGGTPDTETATPTITMTNTVTPTLTVTPVLEYTNGTADNASIQYFGRWDFSSALAPKTGWGTSYIITSFSGTSIKFNLSAWDVWFAYAIDGDLSNPASYTKFEVLDQYNSNHVLPSPTPLIVTGLTDTTHTIMIVRVNEGTGGKSIFSGFGLDPGKTLSSPGPKTARKMEFIGDSITCGSYDEWAGSNPCTAQYGNCIQNGNMAFGPQLARMYNAEGRTISRGGIGVYRNCPVDCDPPATIAAVYNKLFFEPTPTNSADWNFSQWQADVVVLAIGTNDFSLGVPDQTAFETAYSSFLTNVRTDYPNAHIICTEPVPSWVNIAAGQYISNVVTAKADPKIYYVPLNNPAAAGFPLLNSEYAGDSTHPLVAAHTKIANVLKTWIDANIMGDLTANHGW